MQRPFFKNLKLIPCCQKALRDISDKLKSGVQLRAVLTAGPFLTMFGANPIVILYTILSTDWDKLADATKSVSPIVKNRCYTIAQLHALDHPGGDLNRFWVAMSDIFAR